MWDGQLDRTDVTKHQIEFQTGETQPFHSAPYCGALKTTKIEKPEIEKVLAQNLIEIA